MKKENFDDNSANVLVLTIRIEDRKFCANLFDQLEDFPFDKKIYRFY